MWYVVAGKHKNAVERVDIWVKSVNYRIFDQDDHYVVAEAFFKSRVNAMTFKTRP